MSHFKTFAIAGISGAVSQAILSSLVDLAPDAKIYVLSRSATPPIPSYPNVTVVKTDYTSSETVLESLKGKGIEVVIATFGLTGVNTQTVVIPAAKKAGVELFVPSEFGSVGEEGGPLQFKVDIRKLAEKEGLPTATYVNGVFAEYVPGILGKEKTRVLDEGKGKLSITSYKDVARFVAWSLTHLPKDKLYDSTWRLEGDRLSIAELAEWTKKTYGSETVYVSKSDLDLTAPGLVGFVDYLYTKIEEGHGTATWDLGPDDSSDKINATQVWPDWKPKKFVEVQF